MRAEVFQANKDYPRTCTWDSPGAVYLSAGDHERGVHWMPCRDCMGTGHFPVPDPSIPDFCVACKGQGLRAGDGVSDQLVAERIADWHNRVRRFLEEPQALCFSPYALTCVPLAADDSARYPGDLVFPLHRKAVSVEQVASWLAAERERLDAVREQIEDERARAHLSAQARRDESAHHRGHRRGAFQCPSCKRFKPRPSAVCDYCGDDPVTHHGDRRVFDRAHGYA